MEYTQIERCVGSGSLKSGLYLGPMCSTMCATVASPTSQRSKTKSYDYLLKFLLVGDSDVGKEEILSGLADGASESPYGFSNGSGLYCYLSL